ncbi:MAG: IS66 family insertion sequence element accessory protein TnpB [Deltaproteobacteria bacterium]|nr:IS66 family insertion sequence element accessory protein TnpB [Deltaproteobacteria bacterium]
MIALPPSVRIYLCAQPVDGRRGIDALAAMVHSTLALEPLSGHLFCFVAAHGRSARILLWDHNGFVLYSQRLERGRFRLPSEIPAAATHVTLESSELMLLLEGIDLRGARRRPRWEPAPASSSPSTP